MKKLIEVPHWGQYYDIDDEIWKSRSCGIVSLAMILDFYGIKFDLKDLIEEAVEIDNYNPEIGWKHQTIVELAQKYGLKAQRTESDSTESLLKSLDREEPVIISIHKHFKGENGGHLAVLNGYFKADGEVEGFYVCDPVGAPYKHKNQFIPIDKFELGWKKRAIYVKKS